MSKVSFRARQIDFNKPLPILKHGSDLFLEISENALVNRGVPQIPSGMEKEEENEHHFVEVIQALQLRGDADVKIPVPDIINKDEEYKLLYPDGFTLPKQLVHIRTVVFAEDEPVEYDMDSEDEEWLRQSDLDLSPEKFETMIDKLERGCGQKVMNLEEAKYLLQDHPSLVIAVYDYWLNKRVQSRQPLLYAVRQERRDGASNTDPYVAFRRRSEKMQTRKNRKNDEQSYEKMLILREQMDALGEILSRVVKREATKEAIVNCNYRCFLLRCKLNDWDGSCLMEAENLVRKYQANSNVSMGVKLVKDIKKSSSRKRRLSQRPHSFSTTQSSDEAELEDESDDGPFAFIRVPGCRYLKPRPLLENTDSEPRYPFDRYTLTTIPSICRSGQPSYTGYVRRRLSRGGRIVCDRISVDPSLTKYFETLDRRMTSGTIDHGSASPCWRQSKTKDVALLERLKATILSSNFGHPRFPWPISRQSPYPISFESLQHDPKPSCYALRPLFNISNTQGSSDTGGSLETMDHDLSKYDLSRKANDTPGASFKSSVSPNRSADEMVPITRSNRSTPFCMSSSIHPNTVEGHQPILHPKSSNTLLPTSQRLWRRLSKPYTDDSFQPELHKSQIPEKSFLNSKQLDSLASDKLLLLDPSVVPSPKVRCWPRDCGSQESKVPSHLQTSNGVNPSPLFQLPI